MTDENECKWCTEPCAPDDNICVGHQKSHAAHSWQPGQPLGVVAPSPSTPPPGPPAVTDEMWLAAINAGQHMRADVRGLREALEAALALLPTDARAEAAEARVRELEEQLWEARRDNLGATDAAKLAAYEKHGAEDWESIKTAMLADVKDLRARLAAVEKERDAARTYVGELESRAKHLRWEISVVAEQREGYRSERDALRAEVERLQKALAAALAEPSDVEVQQAAFGLLDADAEEPVGWNPCKYARAALEAAYATRRARLLGEREGGG